MLIQKLLYDNIDMHKALASGSNNVYYMQNVYGTNVFSHGNEHVAVILKI